VLRYRGLEAGGPGEVDEAGRLRGWGDSGGLEGGGVMGIGLQGLKMRQEIRRSRGQVGIWIAREGKWWPEKAGERVKFSGEGRLRGGVCWRGTRKDGGQSARGWWEACRVRTASK
jgi:hypothetical protein